MDLDPTKIWVAEYEMNSSKKLGEDSRYNITTLQKHMEIARKNVVNGIDNGWSIVCASHNEEDVSKFLTEMEVYLKKTQLETKCSKIEDDKPSHKS
jgi:hypothetical protein